MTDKEQKRIVADNINNLLNERQLSQKEVADALGVSAQTFNTWCKGIAIPRMGKIQALADYFCVPKSQIIDKRTSVTALTNRGSIPVLGSIPAGKPLDAIQDIQGYVDVPITWVDNHGALVVHGESMSPKYLDGDIVIFKEQPDCESGQDCVVYVNGYDATLKKVIKTETGIILQPINPDYEPVVCGEDYPATILGVVVELRRRV